MAEDKMLTNAPVETDIIDTHSVFMNIGGAVRQVKVDDFKRGLTQNDSLILSELAFILTSISQVRLLSIKAIGLTQAVTCVCVNCGRTLLSRC